MQYVIFRIVIFQYSKVLIKTIGKDCREDPCLTTVNSSHKFSPELCYRRRYKVSSDVKYIIDILPFSVDDLLSLLKTNDIQIYSQSAQIHSELRKVRNEREVQFSL